MAKYKYLAVDGKERFRVIADALNDVFDYKTQKGGSIKRAGRCVYKVSEKKLTWFPYLAVNEKVTVIEKGKEKEIETGGWEQPNKDIEWINIPSPDERFITQIPLKDLAEKDSKLKTEGIPHAVFVCTDANDKDERLRFYGVFKHGKPKRNGVKIWTRISTVLDCEEWKAE